MCPAAIEVEDPGRVYKVCGNKKEKKIRNLELLGILSIFVFRACDRRARERGLIDCTTNY